MSETSATKTNTGSPFTDASAAGTAPDPCLALPDEHGNCPLFNNPDFLALSPKDQAEVMVGLFIEAKLIELSNLDDNDRENDNPSEREEEDHLDSSDRPVTIFSRGIFSKEIDDAVEDKLMENPFLDVEKLIKSSAKNPMNSYLATTNSKQIGDVIETLMITKGGLQGSVGIHTSIISERSIERDELRSILPLQEAAVVKAKPVYESEASKLALTKEKIEQHEADLVSHKSTRLDCERDRWVVETLSNALRRISDTEPSKLPYANVDSREKVKKLAAAFGVTDLTSVEKKKRDDHIEIANTYRLYGYHHSEMFTSTGLREILIENRPISALRDQTTRLFLLHSEEASGKRAREESFTSPSRKRAKTSTMMSPGAKNFLKNRKGGK